MLNGEVSGLKVFVVLVLAVSLVAITGCAGEAPESGEAEEAPSGITPNQGGVGDSQGGEDFDRGVIIDEEDMSNLRDRIVTVQEGWTITVEATGIDEGEELWFQVGDGTGFVHSKHIYEDGTDSYTFESNGRHQIQFSPKRHESPMNKEVNISVRAEITNN